jgi:hypothetical protein
MDKILILLALRKMYVSEVTINETKMQAWINEAVCHTITDRLMPVTHKGLLALSGKHNKTYRTMGKRVVILPSRKLE